MKTLFINVNPGLAGEASYRSSAEHAARTSGKAPIIAQAYGGARLLLNTIPGKVYTFTFTLDKGTVPAFQYGARTVPPANPYSGSSLYWTTTGSSLTNHTFSFSALTSQTQLLFEKYIDGGTSRVFYIDNTKVVEEGSDIFTHYEAEVMQVTDYSPFGAPLPGRTYNAMEEVNKVVVAEGAPALTGWSTANSSTSVSNDAVKVTFTTTNTSAVSMSKAFATTGGKQYRISFNADAATYTNVSVDILGYGGNALSSATLNTGVTHYELDFVANDVSSVIKVSLGTGSGTRTIYLDNVKLEEIKGDVEGYFAGFNGKEVDNETYGNGNAYDFGARILDVRLGRWFKLDPIEHKYPDFSPYNYSLNSPIALNDPNGEWVKRTVTRYDADCKTIPAWKFWVKAKTIEINITIHNAKLYNGSTLKASPDAMQKSAEYIQNDIEKTLTTTNTNKRDQVVTTTVTFNEPIKVVDDLDDVKTKGSRADNLFYIADPLVVQSFSSKVTPIAFAPYNSNLIVIDYDEADISTRQRYENTPAHEFGHNVGLKHSNNQESIMFESNVPGKTQKFQPEDQMMLLGQPLNQDYSDLLKRVIDKQSKAIPNPEVKPK